MLRLAHFFFYRCSLQEAHCGGWRFADVWSTVRKRSVECHQPCDVCLRDNRSLPIFVDHGVPPRGSIAAAQEKLTLLTYLFCQRFRLTGMIRACT